MVTVRWHRTPRQPLLRQIPRRLPCHWRDARAAPRRHGGIYYPVRPRLRRDGLADGAAKRGQDGRRLHRSQAGDGRHEARITRGVRGNAGAAAGDGGRDGGAGRGRRERAAQGCAVVPDARLARRARRDRGAPRATCAARSLRADTRARRGTRPLVGAHPLGGRGLVGRGAQPRHRSLDRRGAARRTAWPRASPPPSRTSGPSAAPTATRLHLRSRAGRTLTSHLPSLHPTHP